jgi:transposase InsO family protein
VIETMTAPQGPSSIARLCALAGVSRATYYRHWHAAAPRTEETALRDVVQRLAVAHRHYGYRRLTELVRREGWAVNHKRVLRLMRTDNLLCLRRRAFVPATTDSRHGWRVVPNLARGLEVTGLDQLWVADITYVRLLEEFAFLAIVLDAFSRRVIGWALEVHLQASLALAALQMALAARRPRPGTLVHHSDRGVQYACAEYTAASSNRSTIGSVCIPRSRTSARPSSRPRCGLRPLPSRPRMAATCHPPRLPATVWPSCSERRHERVSRPSHRNRGP